MTEFVIIVPGDDQRESSMLNNIFFSPIIYIWLIAVVAVTILRLCLRLKSGFQFARTFSDVMNLGTETFGLTLATTSPSRKINRAEKIVILFTTLFGFFAGALFSGHLFGQITAEALEPPIASLDQLLNSNLTIMIPFELFGSLVLRWVEYLTLGVCKIYRLSSCRTNKITPIRSVIIDSYMYTGIRDCAYVAPRDSAHALVNLLKKKSSDKSVFHIVKQRYGRYRGRRCSSKRHKVIDSMETTTIDCVCVSKC